MKERKKELLLPSTEFTAHIFDPMVKKPIFDDYRRLVCEKKK